MSLPPYKVDPWMAARVLMLACGPLVVPMAVVFFTGFDRLPNATLGFALMGAPAAVGLCMIALMLCLRGGSLHHCARTGQIEHMTRLLASSSEVNRKTILGATALHYAAARGDRQCVQTLLESGANPALYDHHGKTPCDWAQAQGQSDLTELLRSKP